MFTGITPLIELPNPTTLLFQLFYGDICENRCMRRLFGFAELQTRDVQPYKIG